MTRTSAMAAGCAALCLGSYGLGRCGRPVPVATVTTQHVETHETAHEVATAAADVHEHEHARVETRTVVTKPDGTRIERDRVAVTGGTTDTHATRAVTSDTTVDQHVDTRTVSTPVRLTPNWRLALTLEWEQPGLQLAPRLRAEAEARLTGPLWAYVSVEPPVLGQSLNVRGGVKLALEW